MTFIARKQHNKFLFRHYHSKPHTVVEDDWYVDTNASNTTISRFFCPVRTWNMDKFRDALCRPTREPLSTFHESY